jgi:ElaB/YqjD/DUF883 family membrane-anchored ribosome-binding protein
MELMERGSTATGTVGATPQTPPEAGPSTLGDKLETLEQGVRDMAQDASTAVSDTVATVRTAMGETADAVKGAWQGGVGSLGRAFALRHHVREHPWLMLGGAAFVGYVAGRLFHHIRRDSA